eukprot:499370-Pelagomonas_calceolata.AAC.2
MKAAVCVLDWALDFAVRTVSCAEFWQLLYVLFLRAVCACTAKEHAPPADRPEGMCPCRLQLAWQKSMRTLQTLLRACAPLEQSTAPGPEERDLPCTNSTINEPSSGAQGRS